MKKPLVLIILDGFGIGSKNAKENAIFAAKTPNLDNLFKNWPTTELKSSGTNVGLPENQMGNSEVGHLTIGSGRIIRQFFTRINKNIQNGDFYKNHRILEIMSYVLKNGGALHLMGLLSDGGVHSHIEHLFALLQAAKNIGLNNIFIHAWLDGRDTSPNSGIDFVKICEEKVTILKVGQIATIAGRYYTMDRDNRIDRTLKAYSAMVGGVGPKFEFAVSEIEKNYKQNITDEFILPAVQKNYCGMRKNDAIIFFNFRADRTRQIAKCFADESFAQPKIKNNVKKFLSFTEYGANVKNISVTFKPLKISNTFGEYISKNNLKQLRIAETEKYAHVTNFFNGGAKNPYKNEERILIPSPKIATYDLNPKMKAFEIADVAVKNLEHRIFDVIVINFANCDMLGHTGNFKATVEAVEAVDKAIGKILKVIQKLDGIGVITADHGNAEKLFNENNTILTSHTTNLVPFCIFNYNCSLKNSARLCDVAPTLLEILNLKKPPEMTGESIIL